MSKNDLVLTRTLDVKPELIWKAWTDPVHVKEWWCPRPWKTVECRMDLKPGGEFYFLMQSPEGKNNPPHECCFLELVPNRKIVWTTALTAGYRPAAEPNSAGVPHFTCVLTLTPEGSGTKYTAIAMHPTEEGARRHEKMGFHEGWGTVVDQMVEVIKKGR
jgi:uncharacterized protein YndB with AHSA1/START domain